MVSIRYLEISMWFPLDFLKFPCGFHVIHGLSTWIPQCGFHVGFRDPHGSWNVDSMWKVNKWSTSVTKNITTRI